MKKTALYPLLTALFLMVQACDDNYVSSDPCVFCPNNTECMGDDCGCPTDKHDMGSWCLSKSDNLFVSASLDCYCLDVVGLYLINIQPITQTPGGAYVPTSSYWLSGRENASAGGISNFTYLSRPDGDSIVIYAVNLPGSSRCQIDDMYCQADLFGKFRGPDTIQVEVIWRRCMDNANQWVNFADTVPLTFIRRR
ncbi:MAG: hypothetical protein SFV52_09380 [Saprospiraceae bacterium]|nr:hypothetical protein [Saprospiraceae bacterium]